MENQNNIILEDEYESPILNSFENINIANFIIHEACKSYYSNFNKKWVPLSFINFYFEEYKRYEFLSPNYLVPFFKLYKEVDVPALIDNYYQAQYNIIVSKRTIKSQLHYLVEDNYYLHVNLADKNVLGIFDPKLYKNLDLITQHLSNSDELVSLQDNYEYYLLKQYVINSDKNAKLNKAQTKAAIQTSEDNTTITNEVLVGTQTDLPKQKGKVFKMFFPKLNLPSPYPILNNKSRINSEHRSKKFAKVDKQIEIINHYKFNGVKYNVSFIEKRKAAKKPPKRKFDFDF